ncbi:MAG: Xaa-Pro peptidase family protein [Pseudomonadota bacterium]
MIEKEEFAERLSRLQTAVAASGFDVFIVSAEESIYYLTGVSYRPLERPFFMIVRPAAAPVLLVPALEQDHLKAAPNVAAVKHYWDYPSPSGQGWPERLHDVIAGAGAVGIEPAMPMEIAQALSSISPVVAPLVEGLRLIKSPAEIAMLRKASRYADQCVQKVIDASYSGVSEVELFSQGRKVLLNIIRDTDYEPLATDVLAAAWPAPLSAQPHGVPGVADRLTAGPHIALGLVRANGYAAECERTFFLEPPAPEALAAFNAMMEARRRACALIRPGAPCAEIDLAAKDFLTAEGYGQYLLHRTGHGFGLGSHEGPWMAEGSRDVLEKNMLISIEPGIYLPGVGGIRHSDTTRVTEDGFEHLTAYPTDLSALTITAFKPMTRLAGALIRRMAGVA